MNDNNITIQQYNNILRGRAGISIVEVLLVVAIIGIISAATTPFLSSFILRNNLETTTDKAISSIRKAQSYSLNGKNDKKWGVCVSNIGTLRLFSGSCNSPDFSEDFSIPDNVDVSSFSTTFSRLYGEPSGAVPITITISTDLNSRIIRINRAGGVEIN